MKKITVLALLFWAAHLTQAQDTLTLEQAVRISLENNYGVRIAENDRAIAANNLTLGNAGMLPRIDANASQNYTIENTRQEFIENRSQEVDGARSKNFNANVALGWTIFDGLGMFTTYDKLEELRKAGENNLRIQLETTIENVNDIYFQIVVEQERLKTLENTLDLSAERVDIARTKYEVGRTSKLEYLTAQVDYNSDTSAFISQIERLHNLKIDLNALMGRHDDADFAVQSGISFVESLDKEELRQSMEFRNAERRAYEINTNVALLEMNEIKAERWPVVGLNTAYNYNTSAAESGFLLNRRANGLSFGITATLPIFNGFNLNRRIQNARIAIETAELARDEAMLALNAELEKAYGNYSSGLVRYNLERSNLAVARENAEIALERYKLGNTTSIEFREAQLGQLEAESRLLDAAYAVKAAEIELLRLSGQILE